MPENRTTPFTEFKRMIGWIAGVEEAAAGPGVDDAEVAGAGGVGGGGGGGDAEAAQGARARQAQLKYDSVPQHACISSRCALW